MTWTHWAAAACGVALGVVHAAGIRRSARRPSATTAVLGLLRMLAVGLALAVAALFGLIIPAAAGWAAGYVGTVCAVLAAWRHAGKREKLP